MSGLILCSKKSEMPYRIVDADVNIYSIEEFAYYLYNNAYFVDEGFFKEELVEYIEKELNLPKIAQKLRYGIAQRMSFSELVMIIVNSSMYYNESELKTFEKELKALGSKGMLERMKARADMLLDNNKLSSAKKTYMNILNNKTYKRENDEFYSSVHMGIGKIFCKMFYHKEALKEFEKAYELNPSDDVLQKIIYTKLSDAYIEENEADLSEEDKINSELVLKCREDVKDMWEQINNGNEFEMLSKVFIYDGRHNLDDYYENVLEILNEWKEDYRDDIV